MTSYRCEECHEVVDKDEIAVYTIRGASEYGRPLEPDDERWICPECGVSHDAFTEMDADEWEEEAIALKKKVDKIFDLAQRGFGNIGKDSYRREYFRLLLEAIL